MLDEHIQRLLASARDAQRAGRQDDVAHWFQAIVAQAPADPAALNFLGMHALHCGDPPHAEQFFTRATAADPAAPDLWMNLAKACRLQGDDAGERAALDAALALDQRHFMALVRLAELHERLGETGRAMERWTGVLAASGMIESRSPELDALFDHARAYVSAQRQTFGQEIDRALDTQRTAVADRDRRRFDACIDHALGRRRIYVNECAGTHFPFLPATEFFDRAHFPWLAEIEARTEAIRAELTALLADGGTAIAPYVAMEPGTPENKWSPLDHSLAWGAMHLWRNGERVEEACARCPQTAAALAALPLADMPARTPTAFFSILRPRTRIPPHTGVSNTRTIIHLPLIVPPGCGFRVGGETREWREGECLAFDDTIEHEAWNDSDQLRAVLIFDVWNPYITETERALLRDFYRASDASAYNPRARVGD